LRYVQRDARRAGERLDCSGADLFGMSKLSTLQSLNVEKAGIFRHMSFTPDRLSSSGIELIKTAGLGIRAVAWRNAASATLVFVQALRTGLLSISAVGGRSGSSL
jgi:hypothetical protein